MNTIGKLIKKGSSYRCSECHMPQELRDTCIFCGVMFTNFEELLLEEYEDREYENFKYE